MKDFKIGEGIRNQRQRKGISQEAMAFDLGISQAAYSKIEREETQLTITRVYDIADILKISAFTLLPKPKYGSGINSSGIKRFFQKIGTFFSFRKKG